MTEHSRGERFISAIHLLDGKVVATSGLPPTPDGFEVFLNTTGVCYFSAKEMITPNHPDKAEAVGYVNFLPEQKYWYFGAALALVSDKCRRAAKAPVHMRNWWRPSPYNMKVSGGNPKGDHPNYCAVDLDYQTEEQCEKAVAVLHRLDRSGLLKMSLGIGKRTTHVGMFSPLGPRHWTY